MKSFVALFTLVASAAAQDYFSVMVLRSASPIHYSTLTARGGKFYLGGAGPSSYCPPEVGDACPSGNNTVFAGGDETLSLAVVVPGGQQVYIAPDGTMAYTAPHSAYMPYGSIVDGWSKTKGENYYYLNFKDGLVGCPPTVQNQGYQVFGKIAGFNSTGCLGFSSLALNTTGVGAWEY
ncbi:hypothetical protein P154DRAFT_570627 [Amniculicola lignicola CBS 123094]|uniref:IgE-binding protein n=1 Tax=Amniculicola lignicola CBS 123094 TaxID=1392246 RepID=A0A6A5WWB7_9PLEO|nr:hypothetical protein P154DRAFT_570627 [Amniculicola lignicola CBS 123094]